MQAFQDYMQEVVTKFETGIAAEHAYRPALQSLFESMPNKIKAVNDPKHIKDVGALVDVVYHVVRADGFVVVFTHTLNPETDCGK
jgi:hypothetical protein